VNAELIKARRETERAARLAFATVVLIIVFGIRALFGPIDTVDVFAILAGWLLVDLLRLWLCARRAARIKAGAR
jgi:hypothetical protein